MPQAASWVGTPSIKGRTESTRMALLTLSLVGLQFTWGIEMTYCTPYLLQLGLTKSRMALVWIAGPLSGLIMQPIVGVITDRSRSKWGRRRPFMIGGSIVVAACLLVLGWTSEIVGMYVQEAETKRSVTIAVAVASIYAVDFAINVVQACCRSLIVDTLPIPQQQAGSAWASRMVAIGHLIGYAVGSIDMVKIFGTTLGDTQFKQMTVIAGLSLIGTVLITSYAVEERILISARDSDSKTGAIHVLSQLFKTALHLPPRIRAICWVQFWAWIGWFPFLFYSTTWVGETYFRYEAHRAPAHSKDTLGDVGRLGSLSLVIFSFITFISSVLLPFCVRPPDHKRPTFSPRPPPGMAALLNRVMTFRPDLQTAWLISHVMFGCTMIFAPLARSLRFATFLVAICGIPWAISCWAPFSFMGVEINRLALDQPTNGRPSVGLASANLRHNRFPSVESTDRPADLEMDVLRLNHRDADEDGSNDESSCSTGELAGIYLGVLNVYTTLPQFLSTLITWCIFSILEPAPAKLDDAGKLQEGGPAQDNEWMNLNSDAPNGIAVCLFIGAISALVAAEATRRLKLVR